ncbi:MAG: RluA family pseudouridine synthase [Acidobacteria bacterium]|nr:RluA family pseudouridine synthase [Acidobacteriota bacterium]
MPTPKRFVVADEDAGLRLDRYLAARLPALSRTRIQELIEEGHVQVGGAAAKRAQRVAAGEAIAVEILPRPPLAAVPEAIPVEILYEDEDLVAVNKPAGMVVHAGAGVVSGTLVNALLHHLGKLSDVGGALRPGIVHRLDRGTSGVLLVARTDEAHRLLADQFRARRVRKTYLALVHGRVERDAGTIGLPIARDLRRRTRMTARRREGREARTDWHVLARLHGFTLVEVDLRTGRMHQIRVHFSALRHPVVGDTLYGAPREARAGRETLPPLGRNFLHAACIAFVHPRRAEPMEIRAPLPADLRAYLERLAAALGLRLGAFDAALRGYL